MQGVRLSALHRIEDVRLVPLGLYPWVSGSFAGTLGDNIGSYKVNIKAILGRPFRGTTLGVQTWNP